MWARRRRARASPRPARARRPGGAPRGPPKRARRATRPEEARASPRSRRRCAAGSRAPQPRRLPAATNGIVAHHGLPVLVSAHLDAPRRRPSPTPASVSIRARAIPRSSIGEKLPLVTAPTRRPLDRRRPRPPRGGCRPSATRPRRRRRGPSGAFGLEGSASPEVALVPPDHPAQAGLQRGDARAELVAVQGQAGLEAQGVAGAEARPGGHRRRASASQKAGGHLGRHGALDAVLAGVAGAGHDAGARPSSRTAATAKRGNGSGLGRHRGQGARVRRDPARRSPPGRPWCPRRPWPRRTRSVLEALGMTSKRSSATHQTMMSSTTEPSSSSRWVYCARPGRSWRRSLLSARCRSVEAPPGPRPGPCRGGSRRRRPRRCGRPGARPGSRAGRPAASPSPRRRPASPQHGGGRRGAVTDEGVVPTPDRGPRGRRGARTRGRSRRRFYAAGCDSPPMP